MLRRNLAAVGGAVLLLSVAACGSGDTGAGASGEQERRSLSVATVTEGIPFLPFYVGLADGTFENAGLDIDVTVSNSGPAVLQAVASRSVNFGAGQADSVAVAASQNAPASVGIGSMSQGIPQNLVFRSGWLEEKGVNPDTLPSLSPSDQLKLLEGARVATYGPGGLIDNVFSELTDVGGVDDSTITRITIPGAQPQLTAIGSNQLDAAVLGSWPPLVKSGENYPVAGRSLGELSPLLGTMPYEIMFVGVDWSEQNREAVQDFTKAFATACNSAREKPAAELAQQLQAAGYMKGSDPALLAVGIEEAQPSIPVNCQYSAESLTAIKDFSVKHDVVPPTLDWSPLYTNDYVE